MVEFEDEGERIDLFDGDDHATIPQPFGDPHAALRGDLADKGSERSQ